MNPAPLSDLAAIARTQLGTEEDKAHTNKGAAIRKYQDADDYEEKDGYAWCASFVCWCVWMFLLKHPIFKINRPKTPSAFGLLEWGTKNNCFVFAPNKIHYTVAVGDIVVFDFSHTGIVSRVPSKVIGHDFDSIEGNSNTDGSRDGYQVVEHSRTFEKVRGFIRLPAPATLA